MNPIKIIQKEGVVAEYNGQYWGVQYQDGYSTSYDFGPIENATVSNPEFCKHPSGLTYSGSPYIEKLSKAKLVTVKILTTYFI